MACSSASDAVVQQVGPHRGSGGALGQRPHPDAQPVDVLLLARGGSGHQLGPGPDPGEGLVGRVVAEDVRPALPQPCLLGVERRERRLQLRALGGPAGVLVRRRGGQLVGQAGALGLERRDDVDVGGGVQGGHDAAGALAQDG